MPLFCCQVCVNSQAAALAAVFRSRWRSALLHPSWLQHRLYYGYYILPTYPSDLSWRFSLTVPAPPASVASSSTTALFCRVDWCIVRLRLVFTATCTGSYKCTLRAARDYAYAISNNKYRVTGWKLCQTNPLSTGHLSRWERQYRNTIPLPDYVSVAD